MGKEKATEKYFLGLGLESKDLDREQLINLYMKTFFIRSAQIFEYSGLPDTIPRWALEKILMGTGRVLIAKHNGDLYALDGGWGGEPDPYYIPTRFIVANPALKLNHDYKIGEDCVLIKSDSMHMGLYGIWKRSATIIADTDITIRRATVNRRVQGIISATDTATYQSALRYLDQVEEGRTGVIMDDGLIESIHVSPMATHAGSPLTELIEARTYALHSFYTEIGIQASTNQKRENVSELEASQNADFLLPLVQDMLECRQEGLKKVNEMFRANITVRFSPLWQKMKEEVEEKEGQDEDSGRVGSMDDTVHMDQDQTVNGV